MAASEPSGVVWLGKWELPQELEARHIAGQLGKARCRAARASWGFHAAVRVAKRLGAFRHRVVALVAAGGHTVVCTRDAVFSFGKGCVSVGTGIGGQLGYLTDSQPTPRVVTRLLAEDVVAATACVSSTLVCTAEGHAYWFGRLPGQEPNSVPRPVAGLERVVGVAGGNSHLLAWTRAGHLYTWGGGLYGQLGHGDVGSESAPRLVEGLLGQPVVGADGAWQHSVACTASGRVYTFGSGRTELGHGPDAAVEQIPPRLVQGLAGCTVVMVSASRQVTAAVTDAGELYTWGASPQGALGHGEEPESESESEEDSEETESEEDEDAQATLPRLVTGLLGQRVVGVSAGLQHTLAWTDSGELYSWGFGVHGQLGHNSPENEWWPRRVEALAGKPVARASAGYSHSMVLTHEQEIYTFGRGDDGRLGLGPTHRAATPMRVVGFNVSASHDDQSMEIE